MWMLHLPVAYDGEGAAGCVVELLVDWTELSAELMVLCPEVSIVVGLASDIGLDGGVVSTDCSAVASGAPLEGLVVGVARVIVGGCNKLDWAYRDAWIDEQPWEGRFDGAARQHIRQTEGSLRPENNLSCRDGADLFPSLDITYHVCEITWKYAVNGKRVPIHCCIIRRRWTHLLHAQRTISNWLKHLTRRGRRSGIDRLYSHRKFGIGGR